MQLPKNKVSTTLATYLDLLCVLVNKALLTLFSDFILQLKNMWKLPGGLSEPGEDIGVYLNRFLFGLKMLKKLMCPLSCSIVENKILNSLIGSD